MREAYEDKLKALRWEIEDGGARPALIDQAVSQLLTYDRPYTAQDLLSLLSDEAEYDEGMFSLVHAAENSDRGTYVQALLSVFPALVLSAPRWASIVLMRVLNSEAAQAEMVRQLRDTSAETKESVREMCGRINKVSPQFLSKTISVTLAAS